MTIVSTVIVPDGPVTGRRTRAAPEPLLVATDPAWSSQQGQVLDILTEGVVATLEDYRQEEAAPIIEMTVGRFL